MSSTPSSSSTPINLSLSSSDFPNFHFFPHNYFHVYVGKIGRRHLVLPVQAQIHESLMKFIEKENIRIAEESPNSVTADAVILTEILRSLPRIIGDVSVARIKSVKIKPKIIESNNFIFTYQFKETPSPYYSMTKRLRHADAEEFFHSSDDEFYPDEEEIKPISKNNKEEEKIQNKKIEKEKEKEEINETEVEEVENFESFESSDYRGGSYRGFQVSKHSLYLKLVEKELAKEKRIETKGKNNNENKKLKLTIIEAFNANNKNQINEDQSKNNNNQNNDNNNDIQNNNVNNPSIVSSSSSSSKSK